MTSPPSVHPANFADRLSTAIKHKQSRVVVGLDPDFDKLPAPLKELARSQVSTGSAVPLWAMREFCEKIISATRASAVAFKPQIAFFERYGSAGLAVLERLLHDYREEIFIVDCKRGDIGNTSSSYVQAYFGSAAEPAPLDCDAVTHNAYMGRDTVEPYFQHLAADRGMFVLCKTSNPGAADLQDLQADGREVCMHMAALSSQWGEPFIGHSGFSSLGLVVGATYPRDAARIRSLAPHCYFLVPGLETQGGRLDDAAAFTNAEGHGAVFNFSRAVLYAYASGPFADSYGPDQYAQAAHKAAEHYRLRLNEVLGTP
ncbi:orotidine-5'-phosphate decarboxylase [bacterium]|nr:orotidine-5'-phosphate decarboxylase [bacterium]